MGQDSNPDPKFMFLIRMCNIHESLSGRRVQDMQVN
jgi:hypothetical protein